RPTAKRNLRTKVSKPQKPTILDWSHQPHHRRLPRQRFSATGRYGIFGRSPVHFALMGGEICAALPDGKEPLTDKLWLELGRLHGPGKPTGKLGGRFPRGLRRRKQPKPIVYFVVLIA